jgi:N-acetylmuramoyl-L-alanine amidase
MVSHFMGRIVAGLCLLTAVACAPLAERSGSSMVGWPSPNFDERRPNFVILHFTSNKSVEPALHTLSSPASGVSSHYLIARDGTTYALVDERKRAWHAGVSYWGGNRDLNSASIGIELDNDGEEPYAEPQIVVLLALLGELKRKYAIPAANFLGHSDVAPRRKGDPGRYFPWQRLAGQGYGLWCEPPYSAQPQSTADDVLLAALGYDVADIDAAIGAFRLHFTPRSDTRRLTTEDHALIHCLLEKRRN